MDRESNSALIRFRLLVLLSITIFSCNALPPATPVIEDQWFDPRYLIWEPVSTAEVLETNWYKDGEIFLGIGQDTLRIAENYTADWSLYAADSYYRLIYKLGSSYMVLYLDKISDDSLRYLDVNTMTDDPQQLETIPASGVWQYLTSRINWHSQACNR